MRTYMRTDELAHYGIKGMHWGVRRTPEQLGHETLRKVRSANLDRWGKSPNTNVLYITGRSGSGKSTITQLLRNELTSVIPLDWYFETPTEKFSKEMDPDIRRFHKYIQKEFPDFNKMSSEYGLPVEQRTEYKRRFADSIEAFGRSEYNLGRKVIAEGIQIHDGNLHEEGGDWYKNKPVIVTTTNTLESMKRAAKRDGRPRGVIGNILSYDDPLEYVNWQIDTTHSIKDFVVKTNAKRGRKYVEKALRSDAGGMPISKFS